MSPTSAVLLIAAVLSLAALAFWYRRSRTADSFAAIALHHHDNAKICSHAELVDGRNHIPVALTLQQQQIFYENPDLDATLDIDQIDEVEYDSDLLTGGISRGAVLRLRAHGRAFEFILDIASAEKWSRLLPPHRMNETGHVHATAPGNA